MSLYVCVCVCTLCILVHRKCYVWEHCPCRFWPQHGTLGTSMICCMLQKQLSLIYDSQYMMSLHFPKKSATAKIPIINQCYQDSLRGNNTTLKSCLAVRCPKPSELKHFTCVGSEATIKFGMVFLSSVHQLRQTS